MPPDRTPAAKSSEESALLTGLPPARLGNAHPSGVRAQQRKCASVTVLV